MKILRDPDPPEGGGDQPTPEPAAPTNEFVNSLPEELREETALAQFKGIEGLAKSYLETKKLVGTKRMEEPTESWDQTKWDELYGKLGRPETPDKYEVPEINLPNDLKLDEALLGEAKTKFHELGLNKKQFAGVMGLYGRVVSEGLEGESAKNEESLKEGTLALKTEWGDKFDANIDIAQSAINKFGGEDLDKILKDSGLGNNPAMVKTFHEIGKRIMEDNAGMGRGAGLPINDQTTAKIRIDELKRDEAFMKTFTTAHAPGHKEAKKQMDELFKAAYPGKTSL